MSGVKKHRACALLVTGMVVVAGGGGGGGVGHDQW
jgi:hypothetical protein